MGAKSLAAAMFERTGGKCLVSEDVTKRKQAAGRRRQSPVPARTRAPGPMYRVAQADAALPIGVPPRDGRAADHLCRRVFEAETRVGSELSGDLEGIS